MKKIYKYKSLIVLLLVFTISFNIITDYKQKEVYAVAGVDDLLYYYLGLLVLSTGVVAVSDSQIIDMGTSVNDLLMQGTDEYYQEQFRIDTIGNIQAGKQAKIKVTDTLKSAINTVAETLTTSDKETIVDSVTQINLGVLTYPLITEYYNPTIFGHYLGKYKITGTFDFYIGNEYLNTYGQEGAESVFELVSYSNVNKDLKISFLKKSTSGYYAGSGILTQVGYGNYDSFLTEPFIIKFSGVADVLETIPYSMPAIKEGYNPTYTDERLKENTYIPLPQAIPTDTTISTEMPLDWETVLDTGIISDMPYDVPTDVAGDVAGDITGSLESGFDITFPNLLDMLKELLIYLFYPTVSLEDVFPFPTDTGLGDLINLYDYSSIWSITPKPIEFKTTINKEGVGNTNISRLWNIEFKPFEIPFIANNLNTIRNVFSYSLLLSVIYAIVHHLLPKREMD